MVLNVCDNSPGANAHKCFECRVDGAHQHRSFSTYKFVGGWKPHNDSKVATKVRWELDVSNVLLESDEVNEGKFIYFYEFGSILRRYPMYVEKFKASLCKDSRWCLKC